MSLAVALLAAFGLSLHYVSAEPIRLNTRSLLGGVVQNAGNLLDGVTNPTSILNILEGIVPTATPTSISQVSAALEGIYSASPTNSLANVAAQIQAGLVSGDLAEALYGLGGGENSQNNNNTAEPTSPVYPRRGDGDAPYSLSEAQLRQAIYIPDSFTYGQKPPTIFIPGTGSVGGTNFAHNLRKLLTNVSYADPVWLNVPGEMVNDAQVNSEYVAYAINYISGISQDRNVSLVSWSQGGLDAQWALTFWPSTRAAVSDFLPVSPDFHGTVTADVLCTHTGGGGGGAGLMACAPSAVQQGYGSAFVAALRARGGASAYVPTTSIYSGFVDAVVAPQSGANASARLGSDHGPGLAVNVELQVACAGHPAAGFYYGHADVLFSPLTYALVADALRHDGPADLARLNLTEVCAGYAADGLSLSDVLATISLTPLSLLVLLMSPVKLSSEPALMSYVSGQ